MKNKTFFLKLLILAESDPKTYKYLKNQQILLSKIEKEGFLPEYIETREKESDTKEKEHEMLELTRKLIQLPPHSTELPQGRLAELFYQVGFYEEPAIEPKEFFELSKSKPDNAIKFLDKTPGNWIHFIGQIMVVVDLFINEATKDQNKLIDVATVTPIKNMVSTILLAFSKYGNIEDSNKKLFLSFSDSLIKLSEKIIDLLDDEIMFINISLNYGSKEFLEQYLTAARFNDFTTYNQIIAGLDKNTLLSSKINSPIINKTLLFLETNFNDVISLIKKKEMLKLSTADEIKNKLVNYFISHEEPQRTELFNIFNESEVTISEDQLNIIVNDIITKSDYEKLTKILNINKYVPILNNKSSKIKELINRSELNNQAFINLTDILWTVKNIILFKLFDNEFLGELLKKLEVLIDVSVYKSYIEILTKNEILKMEPKKLFIPEYIGFLKRLHELKKGDNKSSEGKIKSALKRKLTEFINKLKKGGVENGNNSRRK